MKIRIIKFMYSKKVENEIESSQMLLNLVLKREIMKESQIKI